MKALIGITANFIKDSHFGGEAHIAGPGQFWQALADDYIAAISLPGGIPVILPILSDTEEACVYLDRLDGVLFSGGCDVSPLCSGQDMVQAVGEICAERDALEMALMRATFNRPGYPILCICRGCQLLNVVLGGTLNLDIDSKACGDHFFPQQQMSVPTHRIEVQEGTLIHRILNGENRVNSYHHQCVQKLGSGVVVTARDVHGVPECIEVPSREGFILGVQWHPEGLARHYTGHGNIFRTFVQAAEVSRKENAIYGNHG